MPVQVERHLLYSFSHCVAVLCPTPRSLIVHIWWGAYFTKGCEPRPSNYLKLPINLYSAVSVQPACRIVRLCLSLFLLPIPRLLRNEEATNEAGRGDQSRDFRRRRNEGRKAQGASKHQRYVACFSIAQRASTQPQNDGDHAESAAPETTQREENGDHACENQQAHVGARPPCLEAVNGAAADQAGLGKGCR